MIAILNGYFFGPLGAEGEHSFIIDIKKLSEDNKIELIEGIEALIVNHKTECRGLVSLSKNENLDLRKWKILTDDYNTNFYENQKKGV